jgi:hypothetical protein
MHDPSCREIRCGLGVWPHRFLASVALCALAACSSDRSELTPESANHPLEPSPVTPYGGENPDPQATETNFFSIGCDEDSDCSADRRCKLPSADAAVPKLVRVFDAGAARDAGADAETYPPGLCVLRVVE